MGKTTNILDLNNRLTKVEKENVAQNSYTSLKNKPKINNVTLTGNKNSSDLGLAAASDITNINTAIGDITQLTTTATDLVGGVNEVNDTAEDLKNYCGYRVDINSDLTPASGITITSTIAQKTGNVVTIGLLFNTTAEIAANTAIVSGFNYKTAVNDQGIILTKRNAADFYIGRISRDSVDNNKSNLYNLSVIPANTEIRTCFTILL